MRVASTNARNFLRFLIVFSPLKIFFRESRTFAALRRFAARSHVDAAALPAFFLRWIFSLTICILEVDFKSIFGDVAVYIAVYAIMMLESIMYKYYIQVENSAVIMVMTVLLGIFVSLYSTYHLIVSYDRILKKEMEAKGFYLNA